MGDAQGAFKRLVSNMFLRFAAPAGFRRAGSAFRRQQQTSIAVIDFQKSRDSTRECVRFTINLGVLSGTLAANKTTSAPRIEDCHWRRRIGFLLPEGKDTWWEIDGATRSDDLEDQLAAHLNELALPVLEKYCDDERLRDLWLTGQSPGLTEYQRLKNLVILLRKLGPAGLIEEVQQALDGLEHS